MLSFVSIRSSAIALLASGVLFTGCVSSKTFDECQDSLSSTTSQRDEYKIDLEKRKDDISKCLTQLGIVNSDKEICAKGYQETIDKANEIAAAYNHCRDGCLIQEFEAFQQRTKEGYQTQLDEYKQTSSEDYRTQMERVVQEALTQQSQLQARIAELEQRVSSFKGESESHQCSSGCQLRIEEAQSVSERLGRELAACDRFLQSRGVTYYPK